MCMCRIGKEPLGLYLASIVIVQLLMSIDLFATAFLEPLKRREREEGSSRLLAPGAMRSLASARGRGGGLTAHTTSPYPMGIYLNSRSMARTRLGFSSEEIELSARSSSSTSPLQLSPSGWHVPNIGFRQWCTATRTTRQNASDSAQLKYWNPVTRENIKILDRLSL